MDKGWIKLHRSILENDLLHNDRNAFIVFVHLLLLVGKNKGEWSGGRRQLAALIGINDRTLYDVLQRLQANKMINLESNQRYSVIHILNWHKYQSSSTAKPTSQATTAQPQPNHSPTTAQHSNKKENKKKNRIRENIFPSESPGSERKAAGTGYQKAVSIAEALKNKRLTKGES